MRFWKIVLVLVVALGLGWFLHHRNTYTPSISDIDTGFMAQVPITKPPVTEAKFEQSMKLKNPSFAKICQLFGSQGIEVTDKAGLRPGERLFAWKNSANEFILVKLDPDGGVHGQQMTKAHWKTTVEVHSSDGTNYRHVEESQ